MTGKRHTLSCALKIGGGGPHVKSHCMLNPPLSQRFRVTCWVRALRCGMQRCRAMDVEMRGWAVCWVNGTSDGAAVAGGCMRSAEVVARTCIV